MIERAIILACATHMDQKTPSGQSYVLHPLRVMAKFEGDEEAQIVAVLHDVLQMNRLITPHDIETSSFGNKRIASALHAMTSVSEDESLASVMERCADNELARVVKLAALVDWRDNEIKADPSLEYEVQEYKKRVGQINLAINTLRHYVTEVAL